MMALVRKPIVSSTEVKKAILVKSNVFSYCCQLCFISTSFFIIVFRLCLTRSSFRQNVMLLWFWTEKWSNSSEPRHSSVSMAFPWSEREEMEKKTEERMKQNESKLKMTWWGDDCCVLQLYWVYLLLPLLIKSKPTLFLHMVPEPHPFITDWHSHFFQRRRKVHNSVHQHSEPKRTERDE